MIVTTTKKDIIWNYLGTFLNLGINFILLPIFMFFLDNEYLALWYVFASLGSIVNMFDFGFSPVLARNVAYAWCGAKSLQKNGVEHVGDGEDTEPNYSLLGNVIASCRVLYFGIGLAAFLVLLTAGTVYIKSVSSHLDQLICMSSWAIFIISVFLNLSLGYYAVVLRGVGAIGDYNRATSFGKIFQVLISATLLWFGFGLFAVSFANLVYGLMSRILYRRALSCLSGMSGHEGALNARCCLRDSFDVFATIWHNAWREGLVSFAKYLTTQAGTIVVTTFLGLSASGIYSISMQIATAIGSVSSALFNSFSPAIQNAYAVRNYEKMRALLAKSMFAYAVLFVFGMMGVYLFGIPILEVIGKSYKFDPLVMFCVACFVFVYQRHANYAAFIANTNEIPYMNAYIISGVVGIALSSFVAWSMPQAGVAGMMLPQIIVQLAYNAWKWPSVAREKMMVSRVEFLQMSLSSISRRKI